MITALGSLLACFEARQWCRQGIVAGPLLFAASFLNFLSMNVNAERFYQLLFARAMPLLAGIYFFVCLSVYRFS